MYESTSQTDNAELVRTLADLLGTPRAAVITDVDGTISPMVARPDDAVVLPQARQALLGLRDVLSLVAVVTGRRALDARRMVGVEGLVYVGNHGLEVFTDRAGLEVAPDALPWVPALAALLHEVQSQIRIPGVLFENKGATASLHYRLATAPEATRVELIEILTRALHGTGFRFEEGRRVFNFLPPLPISKGTAVTWLAHEYALDGLVYLGDDITDTHAFSSLTAMRQSGQARTLNVCVGGDEASASVLRLADAGVPSEQAAADLLLAVLNRLRSSATMVNREPQPSGDTPTGHGQGRAHQHKLS